MVGSETRLMRSREMWSRPETSPLLKKGWSLVGRDREMREITEKLLAAECVEEPGTSADACSRGGPRPLEASKSVIAIVGFGGLGKTTLAQAIFNDEKVQGNFNIKKWLFVGKKLDAKGLIKDIIGDGDKSQNVGENLGDLQKTLVGKLQGEKFLIILDDVWTDDPEDWDPLRTALTYGKKGSMIILTTRSQKVARAIGYLSMYVLEGLADAECWEIFKACAFPGGDSKEYPYLESLGRQMVKKLKGVPLAASMMGGFLRGFLHNEEKWKSILESSAWPQTGSKDLVDHVIGLNYQHLPWHLRLCFGYCSIFPKDFVFDKSSLVQMWMALNYIRPHEDGRRPEDIGSDYFDDLHDGCFFQHIGGRYVMHDMVHDFAEKVFKEGHQMTAGNVQVRHLSVSCDNLSECSEVKELRKLKKLRTFRLSCKGDVSASDLDALLTEFKYLRVLELSGHSTWELPDSIGDLRLLRYLDLLSIHIKTMSKSVCNLHNLQTFKWPTHWNNLPEGWTELGNLRHLEGMLDWEPDSSNINMKGIGRLTLLQGLEWFSVDNHWGIKITELHKMNHLRGKLRIDGLESVEGREEAKLANLVTKGHLQELQLVWAGAPWEELVAWDESLEGRHLNDSEVLEGLQLPPYLRKLEIENNFGLQLPSWMVQRQQLLLPSTLVSLLLKACYFLTHLPHLAHLSFLEELIVEDCPGIQCLPEGGLPFSLKRLSIYGCPRLLKHCQARDVSQLVIISGLEDLDRELFTQAMEASVSGWLALVASKVASLSFQEFIKRCGVKEGIRNLSEKLQSVQAVLEDATMADTQYGMNPLMDLWLKRLKAVAYDIEDMLDDWAIHASDCFTLNPSEASFHQVIENGLKSIGGRLDAIEKYEHHLNHLDSGGETSESQLKKPQASGWKSVPFPEKGRLLIGRDREMMMIKEELLAYVNQGETSPGSRHGQQLPFGGNVPVIGIVGWHTNGKTTLAQAIFDDEEVKASFNMRKWLFVENIYDETLIIKGIISDGGSTHTNIGENLVDLRKQLRDKLKGNRCLLVLDDVREWYGTDWIWGTLRVLLTLVEERGTIVILITRRLDVAHAEDRPWTRYHMLNELSGEMCWKIFEGRAFPCGDSGEHPFVRGLRERIAEAVKGDPLSASMMGGLLRGYLHDENKLEWLLNRFFQLPTQLEDRWAGDEYLHDHKSECLQESFLGLTYQHLPWHLKLCLAYCSTFPKNFMFDKSKMVQMWIAQGYVQPEKGRQLEDVGSDYFDDLHRISAFHCIGGKYVMQNRVCSFARAMNIGDGVQLSGVGWFKETAFQYIRHLSFTCNELRLFQRQGLRYFKGLRTFRLKCEMCSPSDLDDLLAEFKYVRVLELDCHNIVQLPPSIRHMKLLRYLDISKTAIKTLPELPNLQYLELNKPPLPDFG